MTGSQYPRRFDTSGAQRDGVDDTVGPRAALSGRLARGAEVPVEWRTRGDRVPGATLSTPLDEWTPDLRERSEPLTKTWGRFFATIPEAVRAAYPYPNPNEQAFWELYTEPVTDIIRTALVLVDVVADLQPNQRPDLARLMSGDVRSWARLNALLAPVRSAVVPSDDGTLRQAWWCPSLISALAVQLRDEVTGALPPLTCADASCHRVFLPSRESQKYCSTRCRNRQQKRDQRAREGS